MPNQDCVRNLLLRSLPHEDLKLLLPDLHSVALKEGQCLETAHAPIEQVYFIESGLASVVASNFRGLAVEAGLIGRDGMTGTALVLHDTLSPFDCLVQIDGTALALPAAAFRHAIAKLPGLARLLVGYARALGIQTTYTALASAQTRLEERLARWILMVHDRVDGEMFHLTHDFLAMTLGVRRPGVSEALQRLEAKKLIRSRRREILVRDRAGLVALTRNTYGPGELEYQRLIGVAVAKNPDGSAETAQSAA